tara:strand:+ start:231 stop:914 length:684 start_codon:yes stop_codon:yes gene_type:complete
VETNEGSDDDDGMVMVIGAALGAPLLVVSLLLCVVLRLFCARKKRDQQQAALQGTRSASGGLMSESSGPVAGEVTKSQTMAPPVVQPAPAKTPPALVPAPAVETTPVLTDEGPAAAAAETALPLVVLPVDETVADGDEATKVRRRRKTSTAGYAAGGTRSEAEPGVTLVVEPVADGEVEAPKSARRRRSTVKQTSSCAALRAAVHPSSQMGVKEPSWGAKENNASDA